MSYTNLPRPQECVCGDARRDETYGALVAGRETRALAHRSALLPAHAAAEGREEREKRRGVKIDRDPVVRFEDVRAYRKFTEEWLPRAAAPAMVI